MSDDPETARQIAELARDDRPLLVLDVDDVVLEFVQPLSRYLTSRGFDLRLETFALQGNVVELSSGERPDGEAVRALMHDFFAAQAEWQGLTEGVAEELALLASGFEIVLLTAMPHRYRGTRRALLDRFGLPYPLLTTERAKGSAVRALRGEKPRPVAFMDDLHNNLLSVRKAVADAHLFHLMADNSLRALLPPTPDGMVAVETWREAGPEIARALGVERRQ